ncbi:MlaE family ABC transporter permease [Aeromicrobium ginsengisoli]|uniref:ABC transporter permease n=1 Tax=Aeromicrobium ginsengisoli TaxID=363867 RepID=A0A5M4F9B7_9ACTN|nr:ABC transporter permease [Aeromicrobium ginsengisoli]KAA1394236.1 ABC transporter permease [Aeromicrobium ginsengisoli]
MTAIFDSAAGAPHEEPELDADQVGTGPAAATTGDAKALGQARLEEIGSFVRFAAKTIRSIPTAVRLYPSEVARQASRLITENSLVILFMLFMMGAVLGLTAHFLFTSIGIDSYIAAVNSVGGMRGIIQVVFGWIVAAKVGCGIVAEIGAMRISEEIDAMEVMGIRSIPYLASTRLVAAMFVMPMLFITALSVNFIAGYLFNVTLLNTVSSGGFGYFLFLFQNLKDFFIAMFWGTFLGTIIVLVATYYGYTAKGGPVGVGRNTAQSMLVNLVLVSMIGMALVQLFYGNDPNAPIGN